MRARLLSLCIVALVAAGCGDDDEETTVTQTTTVTETETVTTPREPPEPEPTTPDEPREAEPEDGGRGEDEDGAVTAPVGCGRITFEQNTDSGASGITAVGVGCDTARAVARAARGRADDLSYEADGFSCRGTRRDQGPLPTVGWVCLRGEGGFVRFDTT